MPYPRTPSGCVALLALVAGIAVAGPSHAERPPAPSGSETRAPKGMEGPLASAGYEAYQAGDHVTAIAKLEEARQAEPSGAVLAWLGYAYAASGKPIQAVDALELALAETDKPLTDEQRESAQEKLGEARLKVATVTITSSVEGATVSIDRGPPQPLPVKDLRLLAGDHDFVVAAPGHESVERTEALAGGGHAQLDLDPTKAPPPALPTPAPAPPARVEDDSAGVLMRTAGIGVAVLGALAAGVGVASLVSASALRESAADAKTAHDAQFGSDCSLGDYTACYIDGLAINEDIERADNIQALGIGMTIGGGVFIVGGVLLYALAPSGGGQGRNAAPASRVVPLAWPGSDARGGFDMKKISTCLFLALALVLGGCEGIEEVQLPPPDDADHTVAFVGYVFDGATGERIETYTLQLLTDTATLDGTIADSRYTVGDISVWNDYTVIIEVGGYRAFRSHNARAGLPAEFDASSDISEIDTHQVFHFDAYLFPEDLVAPAVTLTINTTAGAPAASGTIRMRPTAASVLANSASETPVGVPGQQWVNDEDLQLGTITKTFSGGTVGMTAGELVYGVAYQVNIYDVEGYQPFEGSYTAGIEADKLFTLTEEITAPLMMLDVSTCATATSPSDTTAGLVTIQFNQDIQLGTSAYPGGALEALDDGLSISSPNQDADADQNTLNLDASSVLQERATSLSVAGDTLTFFWDASSGLSEIDVDDPIDFVQWSNLTQIIVQKANQPASAQSLSTLIGQSTISCI